MSRRSFGGLAAVSAASLAVVALPASAGAVSPPHARTAAAGASVGLRSTALGKILVNSRGHTLYAFSKDSPNRDRCVAIAGCIDIWPMLATSGKPHAGAGVKGSQLSTITIAGGRHQVTYAGHPLYTYSADSGPGQTDYVGAMQFGGTWRAVTAAGSVKG
ncbi:MAG: COG4315 family predicted lipoprotein [Solirubrobacteraceae bacterium]